MNVNSFVIKNFEEDTLSAKQIYKLLQMIEFVLSLNQVINHYSILFPILDIHILSDFKDFHFEFKFSISIHKTRGSESFKFSNPFDIFFVKELDLIIRYFSFQMSHSRYCHLFSVKYIRSEVNEVVWIFK